MMKKSSMIKSYSDVIKLKTFEERFRYLQLKGVVGDLRFNGHRYLNQLLYRCSDWKKIRHEVIIRDNGCDLAIEDRPIFEKLLVHHINPITAADILERNECVFNLENLICVSHNTHNAIHYADERILVSSKPIERELNDTIPWR